MKKALLSLIVVLFISGISVSAQGGFQRRTPEESTKLVMTKLDSAFKFDDAMKKQVNDIFFSFYESRAKIMEDAMSSGSREGIREKIQPLNEDRDAKLKTALGDEKYKTWKEKIEPAMMQPRGGRGQGGGF